MEIPSGFVPVPIAAIEADMPLAARKILLRLLAICWNGVEFVRSQPMTKQEIASKCAVDRRRLSDNLGILDGLNLVNLVPVMAGALFVVNVKCYDNGRKSDRHGIVFPEHVGGDGEGTPTDRTRVAKSDNMCFPLLESYARFPQVQEQESHDGRKSDNVITFPADEKWAKFGALVAVGVWQNRALEIASAEDISLKTVLRHIRAWQAEGERTGVALLVERLAGREPEPDVCEDCGHSRKGTHNDFCPTCRDFMRAEYLKHSTIADGDDGEEV